MNGKIIVNAVIFLTILFGLYTIYDHQEKYLGGVPAKQCRSGRTVSQPRSHFTTGAPSVSVEAGVGFDQELFNSTDNLDEMLTITMEKHFGDIRSNAFEILDQYGRLTDENTLFDLKSSVRSFLAKSKIIHDLREMHKEIQRLKLEAPCQPVNVTQINLFYKKIEGKIAQFNRLNHEVEQIKHTERQESIRLSGLLADKELERSKESSNLNILKKELESNTQGKKRILSSGEKLFMDNYHTDQKELEEKIKRLEVQRRETGVTQSQVGSWNSDLIARRREIIRLEKSDLPLINKVNDLKVGIEKVENVNRENLLLADDLVRIREQFQMVDQSQGDTVYRDFIKNKYLGLIRRLIELKHEAFRKEKAKHTYEELERRDIELQSIEKYLQLTDEISRLTKEQSRIRNLYLELLSIKETDVEANKDQIRQKIQRSEAHIAELAKEIERLKSIAYRPTDLDRLSAMSLEADRLRNEIEPEYHIYMKRVTEASKSLSECRSERIKLEGKRQDLKHRIEEIYSRLGGYNQNIGTILTIIEDKVPDK